MNDGSKPKRVRLSKKQQWFIINLFEAGLSITDTLERIKVRRRTLQRWLAKPLFIKELEMYLGQTYLEARMEIARSIPPAVTMLQTLASQSLDREQVRRTCNDLIKLQHEYGKADGGFKADKKGTKVEMFGALLEQFGVLLDNNGVVSAQLGIGNIPHQLPQKPPLQLKNAENASLVPLLASPNAAADPAGRPEGCSNAP